MLEKEIKEHKPEVSYLEINRFIDLFKVVNPSYERLFMNKTERAAAKRLIEKHGWDKIGRIVDILPFLLGKRGCPQITTPYQLEVKMGQLFAFYRQLKGQQKEILI